MTARHWSAFSCAWNVEVVPVLSSDKFQLSSEFSIQIELNDGTRVEGP